MKINKFTKKRITALALAGIMMLSIMAFNPFNILANEDTEPTITVEGEPYEEYVNDSDNDLELDEIPEDGEITDIQAEEEVPVSPPDNQFTGESGLSFLQMIPQPPGFAFFGGQTEFFVTLPADFGWGPFEGRGFVLEFIPQFDTFPQLTANGIPLNISNNPHVPGFEYFFEIAGGTLDQIGSAGYFSLGVGTNVIQIAVGGTVYTIHIDNQAERVQQSNLPQPAQISLPASAFAAIAPRARPDPQGIAELPVDSAGNAITGTQPAGGPTDNLGWFVGYNHPQLRNIFLDSLTYALHMSPHVSIATITLSGANSRWLMHGGGTAGSFGNVDGADRVGNVIPAGGFVQEMTASLGAEPNSLTWFNASDIDLSGTVLWHSRTRTNAPDPQSGSNVGMAAWLIAPQVENQRGATVSTANYATLVVFAAPSFMQFPPTGLALPVAFARMNNDATLVNVSFVGLHDWLGGNVPPLTVYAAPAPTPPSPPRPDPRGIAVLPVDSAGNAMTGGQPAGGPTDNLGWFVGYNHPLARNLFFDSSAHSLFVPSATVATVTLSGASSRWLMHGGGTAGSYGNVDGADRVGNVIPIGGLVQEIENSLGAEPNSIGTSLPFLGIQNISGTVLWHSRTRTNAPDPQTGSNVGMAAWLIAPQVENQRGATVSTANYATLVVFAAPSFMQFPPSGLALPVAFARTNNDASPVNVSFAGLAGNGTTLQIYTAYTVATTPPPQPPPDTGDTGNNNGGWEDFTPAPPPPPPQPAPTLPPMSITPPTINNAGGNGGTGGEIGQVVVTLPGRIGGNGVVSANVTPQVVIQAMNVLREAARAAGNPLGGFTVTIELQGNSPARGGAHAMIGHSNLNRIAAANANLEIVAGDFSVMLDPDALRQLSSNIRGDLRVQLTQQTSMHGTPRAAVGERPAVMFNLRGVLSGVVNELEEGEITLGIAHEGGGDFFIGEIVGNRITEVESTFEDGVFRWNTSRGGVFGLGSR